MSSLLQGDFAAALGLAVGAGDFLAVVGDVSLDLVGREVRVFLEDERDRTGGDGGGFAGAGSAEVPVAEQAFGVVDVDVAVRDAQALDVGTDGDEVGVLARPAPGGAGRVVADDVVVEGGGSFGVVAAGGDDVGVVGGVGEAGGVVTALVAGVAGGDDDGDAGFPGLFEAVLGLYVPPDPQKIQAAFQANRVSLNPAGGSVNLIFTDYALPGDKMTLTFDTAAKKITGLNINTYMGQEKDSVTSQVQMGSLPDGTNYEQQTVLNAAAKQLVVTTTNSNYQKLGAS